MSSQIRDMVDCDPRFVWHYHFDTPRCGQVTGAHMPLEVIRELAPETFEKLRLYSVYAVTRNPRERFASSLAEHLKKFHGTSFSEISHRALGKVVDDVMTHMARTPVWVPPKYSHFLRQTDFVYLDGEKMVQNLYTTETLPQFAEDIRQKHGLELDPNYRRNRRVTDAAAAGRKNDRRRRRGTLPAWLRGLPGALSLARPAVRSQSTDNALPDLLGTNAVTSFVDEFYADDFDLWRHVSGSSEREHASIATMEK